MKNNSKNGQGKFCDDAENLKPFLAHKISLNIVRMNLDGYISKRDFQWYVGDKKWPLGLEVRASQI